MKSLASLHQMVLRSVGSICSADTARDSENLSRRVKDEGDSYLTITLPRFAKALEKGLDTGMWPAQDVCSTWDHVRGLPRFLSGFLSRIFMPDGTLQENPDAMCIWAVRQVCYLTHKVERDCSPKRIAAAFDQFLKTDEELSGLLESIDSETLESVDDAFWRLFRDVSLDWDRKIANYELVPGHGPGAVAQRLSQLEKRTVDYWPERLSEVFPSWRYSSNLPQWKDHDVVPSGEHPVRVITVPKTQSTPRIIAIEPSTMQYAQQGLKREMYESIERGFLGKILGFTDQTRNQALAYSSSIDGSLATLDLSEASDRVSFDLVMHLFRRTPHVRDFLDATRSRQAEVEGHGIIRLHKFASMGSALTFPIEAMVFTAIALAGMEQAAGRQYRLRELPGKVSVYGDDIIIPVASAGDVVSLLEAFRLKVNTNKSFWTGKFRESCGSEFYDGTDVSVVRLRQELPSSHHDAALVAALVDFRNRCYYAGLWGVVKEADQRLESLIRLPYANATTPDTSPGYLHLVTSNEIVHTVRWNESLQRPEIRVPFLVGRSKSYFVDGPPGVLEWFHSSLRRRDIVDRYQSEERPTSFNIKRRWTIPHSRYSVD